MIKPARTQDAQYINGENSMFTITIGRQTLKRYKLQWYSYNGKRYYVNRTRILHGTSLESVKNKALLLFGSVPDNIQRV